METTENQNLIEVINNLQQRITELETHQPRRNVTFEPAECNICHKTFKNKYILKTHIETMHNENRIRFHCERCGKTFLSKYYLAKHISIKHSDENPTTTTITQSTTTESESYNYSSESENENENETNN